MKLVFNACAALLAASLSGAGAPARAQNVEQGALLVATEALTDPRFSESVVLLIHHDTNGTLGVVINRPTRLEPPRVFPELEYLQDYTVPVYYGGPVAPTRPLLLLRRPPEGVLDGPPVLDDVYATGDLDVLRGSEDSDGDRDRSLRVYAGHAEWQPGQLDREVAAGHWDVRAGAVEVVFSDEPLELWRRLSALGSGVVARSAQRPPIAVATGGGSASRSALR